ncbi:hypothetical protein [Priestia aryabhattai]
MNKLNTFEYEGLVFEPYKTFTKREDDFNLISKRLSNTKLTPSGWNYNKFYEASEVVNGREYDLFKVNGKIVIPAENFLFEYK